jgi:hypothetical protein
MYLQRFLAWDTMDERIQRRTAAKARAVPAGPSFRATIAAEIPRHLTSDTCHCAIEESPNDSEFATDRDQAVV